MKKLILAVPVLLLVLMLAACQTMPDESSTAVAVNRAVGLEEATAVRCVLGPQSPTEKIAQTAARLLFVSRYGPVMTPDQRQRYDLAVIATNDACGR